MADSEKVQDQQQQLKQKHQSIQIHSDGVNGESTPDSATQPKQIIGEYYSSFGVVANRSIRIGSVWKNGFISLKELRLMMGNIPIELESTSRSGSFVWNASPVCMMATIVCIVVYIHSIRFCVFFVLRKNRINFIVKLNCVNDSNRNCFTFRLFDANISEFNYSTKRIEHAWIAKPFCLYNYYHKYAAVYFPTIKSSGMKKENCNRVHCILLSIKMHVRMSGIAHSLHALFVFNIQKYKRVSMLSTTTFTTRIKTMNEKNGRREKSNRKKSLRSNTQYEYINTLQRHMHCLYWHAINSV